MELKRFYKKNGTKHKIAINLYLQNIILIILKSLKQYYSIVENLHKSLIYSIHLKD